ncbi:MAG: short-chain dehydrogenase [Phycisphaerae bacterium]|nr:MAG: short-chain dehydrogenase [Phycisphaerae bacterium]
MIELAGKRALVCGSTQGMGRASAIELAKLGASVTLVARNAESLDAACKELDSSRGQQHATICQDFSDPQALGEKVEAYAKSSGPIHILLNNTGGPGGGPILAATPEEFVKAFSQHLICNQLLTQAVVPGMKSESFGRIINIISTSVKVPIPGLGVSNTTRGAVASWAKTMAGELGQFGITVNNLLPGFIDTARIYDVINARAKQTGKDPKDVQAMFIGQIPAGRFGSPQEVANVVSFLASPAASYVNGINIPVDGGRTPTL